LVGLHFCSSASASSFREITNGGARLSNDDYDDIFLTFVQSLSYHTALCGS